MTERCRLEEAVEISPGYSIASAIAHDPKGPYSVVLARHVDPDGKPLVYPDDQHAVRMALPTGADAYLIHAGDVLFVARGERNRAVVIRACPEKTIAPSTFFVLRPRTAAVHSDYLAWFLNQVPAQIAIAQLRTGAGTPIVQRQNLGGLSFAIASISWQRACAKLGEMMLAENELLERLQKTTQRKNRLIGRHLAEGAACTHGGHQ
jgi:hypothetical protein